MIRFEDIYETVKRHHPGADLEILRKAYVFSAVEHKGQTRASGEPYLVHPLEVAAILAELRMDPACVAVGLLHDVLEDTLTDAERIKEYFGADVLHIVEGVTKIGKIPLSTSEERQAENYRKMLLAMVDDIRVILVKLADRLHNMRTLQYLPEDRRVRIARETMDIYAPLAGRLGMSKIKNELEDLSFQYLEPEAYKDLSLRVGERRKQATAFIEKVKATVAEKLKAATIEASLEGRIKRLYSIHHKLRRQRIDIDQVYDFVALRILVRSIPDCYAALGVLHNMWRPVPGRIKDFIAMPRPNGYQSLHTSVIGEEGHPFEIQIRTEEMHGVAEEGIAAHWKYKEGRTGFDKEDHAFSWLRQLLEWQQEVKDPHEFLNSLKLDLYPEEVYCFTPKGEVKTLPRGSSPVDFAYAIHTEVGNQCVGARVNGKMVPLRYKLKNGDIVEILTASGHHPSRDWLALTVTNKARAKIRHYLNVAEKQQAVDIGKKHCERELKRYDITLKKLLADPAKVEALAQDLGVGTKLDDLFAAVGYGKLSMRQVLARLVPAEKLEAPPAPEKARPLAEAVKRLLRVGEERIKVRGTDDLLVYRAKCCNPIMGEPIVGYITRGKGVSVHSQNCPNVVNLLYDPERRMAVEWEHGSEGAYDVRIAVDVEDRPGLLAAITAVLAGMSTDIRDAQVRTFDDRTASIELTLRINDLKHLDKVVKSVRGVAGVIDVERQAVPR
ncbi:MAG TPA: bifunctional (p)ppGpp synthetase/guanosine-3',5'-bis(diphosphate) 3'-pyrophosphohydrolase [Vicinamibacteria bacterium]|jgi:GTP pyrophosphokinase|nr:bifunctional (p)ppGpp synthetase/guanosine-3',5'-bis(diphosphate) 3'-pyrophosphohydrolase [Vicinamibacteria bacterium]